MTVYGETLDWQSAAIVDAPPLQAGEVHLWWVPLQLDDRQLDRCVQQLTQRQQDKASRLPTAEKRRIYLAGRFFLNQLLCAYLQQDSFELVFGDYGKPALKQPPIPLCFNFSDTCGYGIYAFSHGIELGVDLESTARRGRFQTIIDRRFSAQEQSVLNGDNAEQFLACWTRKEAYGKALGVGLNYPLSEHSLCDSLTESVAVSPDQQWCLQQIAIQSGDASFVACLASFGKQQKALRALRLI